MLLQIAKYGSSDYTIGNYKGLLLSKTVLEKYNCKDKVEVILEKNRIFLKPIDTPWKNWEKAFKEMKRV